MPTVTAKVSNHAPNNPKEGDYWFNAVDGCIYAYKGGMWLRTAGATVTYSELGEPLVNPTKVEPVNPTKVEPSPDHYGGW